MAKQLKVGVLAFHGDVSEHVWATEKAAQNLGLNVAISLARTKADTEGLDALIIPGGESSTLYKLCEREGMIDAIKTIPNIFGTCAGAIMLARKLTNAAEGQQTLSLMDITVTRNAYGRQDHSFETTLDTPFGPVATAFIRAPRIDTAGENINSLAIYKDNLVACEQRAARNYYLALTFHPELTTAKFHEYFLTNVI